MKPDKVEPVLYLLFIGILLFAGILIGVNATWPNDGQMFQVIAGNPHGLLGGLLRADEAHTYRSAGSAAAGRRSINRTTQGVIMADVTPQPTPPAPTAEHHFNLGLFLKVLLAVAPAVTAPFVKNPHSQEIFDQEAGVLAGVLGAINKGQ